MLQQLIYASRANFEPVNRADGVEPTVARILQASRRNNPKRQLGGALYYRDGYFFQVLEGPQANINALVQTLKEDDRHTDFKILSSFPIPERRFSEWSMKYVDLDESVNQWLGGERFDPLSFDEDRARSFAAVLNKPGGQAGPKRAGPGPVAVILGTLAVTAAILGAAFVWVF